MATLYTPKQAQEMLGVSATGLRIYTTNYPKHLSTEATGKRRKFTEADLCFLAYIKQRTDAGDNHRELLKELDTDEGKERWHAFEVDWDPLLPPDEDDEGDDPSTTMVPVAQLQAARLLFEDAQRREQEAKEEAAALQQAALERERQLQEQINQLLRELGHKEGELDALRASKPKGFWSRLLGGSRD